jgi:hypothetical protein
MYYDNYVKCTWGMFACIMIMTIYHIYSDVNSKTLIFFLYFNLKQDNGHQCIYWCCDMLLPRRFPMVWHYLPPPPYISPPSEMLQKYVSKHQMVMCQRTKKKNGYFMYWPPSSIYISSVQWGVICIRWDLSLPGDEEEVSWYNIKHSLCIHVLLRWSIWLKANK